MRLRDSKGRFIKGHTVPDEWRESIGEKNGENMLGNEPWNKGLAGIGVCKPNSGSFQPGSTAGNWERGDDYEVWNKGMSGYQAREKHWNWQGGISTESHIRRNLLVYKQWRKAVFERDEYTCKRCGWRGGYLHAHHITGFAENEESQFEVENGLTLCRSCHYIETFGYPMPEDSKWGLSGIAELLFVEIRET